MKDSRKIEFIESFKIKTKEFGKDVIRLMFDIEKNTASNVISYQLIKSCTSVGANYRAACLARSKNEFFSKISIVVEEIDESLYWLELIKDLGMIKNETELNRIIEEGIEISKVVSTAKKKKYN
ncbi:MAG: four helix bundle protein [Saprospiraceae bacterium]|nr:four helix bundle protein [Bacteroidia bacterium]NNF20443.1 four helix bundle protein [Saprospiraceae bacterium]